MKPLHPRLAERCALAAGGPGDFETAMNDAPTITNNWTAARELEAHLEWLRIAAVVGYQQHSTDLTVYVRHPDDLPRVPGSYRGRRITCVVRQPDYAKGTT